MKYVGKIVGGLFTLAVLATTGVVATAEARDSSGRSDSHWNRDNDRSSRDDRGHYDRNDRGNDHRWDRHNNRHYERSYYRPQRYYSPPPYWAWYAPPRDYYYGY